MYKNLYFFLLIPEVNEKDQFFASNFGFMTQVKTDGWKGSILQLQISKNYLLVNIFISLA